jgi:ubiquinone/menaquinone biosynthesis C-methylase UbiE
MENATTTYPETADIETSTDEYANRFAGACGAWMLEVQEKRTLAQLGKHPEVRTVLDVGGGHGQLAHPLVRDGYRVTVLGSDASCAHRIQTLIDTESFRFEVGNVIALPYPDKSFDAVICFRLVTHCERWPQLIAECCRVAKHTVTIDYPTSTSLNAIAPLFFKAKKNFEKNTRTWTLFTHRQILGELEKNGYTCKHRTGQFFFPMVVHRMLKSRGISASMEAVSRALGLNYALGSPVIATFSRR